MDEGDAIVAAEDAHARLVELEALRAKEIERRREACRWLASEGWSLAQVAHLLGVSKSRVAQIVG